MDRIEPRGSAEAPLRRAATAEEVDLLLEPGVIVEVSPEVARALGACRDDCIDAEEAFAASGDPCEYGDEAPA